MFFRFCRFTFSSVLLVIMIFDILAIGESFTFTTPLFYIFILSCIMCVFFTYSLTFHTSRYSDMVLQFSGFDRQCAQCISLLYPVRYLTIFVWGSSLMRETEVIVSSQCKESIEVAIEKYATHCTHCWACIKCHSSIHTKVCTQDCEGPT